MEKISLSTSAEKEFIDISSKIQKIVTEKKWSNGVLTVFVPHTTAAVTINENADPDVPHDVLTHMKKLIPRHAGYLHAEGNSDSHILSSLFGSSAQIIVENGKIQLGTWQSPFFCEFDGPRERKIWIQFVGKENT